MKRTIVIFLFALGLFSVTSHADDRNKAAHPTSAAGKITPCAPGVVYVKLKSGSVIGKAIKSGGVITQSIGPSNAFARVANELGINLTVAFDAHAEKDSISRAFGIDRIYSLYYTNKNIDPHAALAMLMTTGEVECGSVRYLFPVSKQTNDPYLSQEYGLVNMNVFNAWNTTTGDTSIVIADVDNAINIDHEDLKNQIKYNWGETGLDAKGHNKETNGIDDDSDGYIDNYEGWDCVGDVDANNGVPFKPNNNPRPREAGMNHGTLTAGCILAQGDNGVGVAGVAYSCKLLPIKAAGSDGFITGGNAGMHYASTHGARIINCSFGGSVSGTDTAYENIFLNEAHARGLLVVASAGNGTNDNGIPSDNDVFPVYPANGPFVLSVGATDEQDKAAGFSNYGHSVSVWAPGNNIISTDYPNGNSYYGIESGTSFSSPYTAGVAGLLWSVHQDWIPEFIAKQIIATCDNVVNPGDQNEYWGRVNAGNALSTSPVGPGLIISGYSLDNVASDSLGANHTYDIKVTFKNVLGNGSNLSATPITGLGATLSTSAVSLGSLNELATASGDFQITRTGVYSQGNLPIRFAVTDGASYTDTLTLFVPLTVQPGFVLDRVGANGSSIFRVSNTSAWGAFGLASTNSTTNTTVISTAQFTRESGSIWTDTTKLGDGLNPPYDITALDSNTAWFGSGPPGGTASVIHTKDGGKTFDTVSVATFAAFINTIHFFDAQNGILIGDPVSSYWGIGITSDGGKSWHPLTKRVFASGSIASWNNATAWVGDNGWYGTNSRQILRTKNRGQSWQVVKTDTNQHSLGIGFDDDATHGFACFRPAATSGGTTTGSNGLMATSDSGATWHLLTTLPAPGMSPASVQFIPHSDTAILTSNLGVYRTTDFGSTWTPIGIPVWFLADGSDISISRGQGKFVVSIISGNNGIASYSEAKPDDTIPDTVTQHNAVSDLASNALLLDVYPNPTQSNAIVSFMLPASCHVTIGLYDALGRNVAIVANGEFGSGSHTVTMDGRGLAPGSYYLDMDTGGGGHLTRAITLLQ